MGDRRENAHFVWPLQKRKYLHIVVVFKCWLKYYCNFYDTSAFNRGVFNVFITTTKFGIEFNIKILE